MSGVSVGVLGGGQLGRMFVHAAQQMGLRVVVLEPDPDSPAGRAADRVLRAAYDDAAALADLGSRCVAVTTEFENVPATSLDALAAQTLVSPPAAAVRVCQHRAREKQLFERSGVPCAPWVAIESAADLERIDGSAWLPGILKTAQLGYDGKGQVRVDSAPALAEAWHGFGGVACVLEALVPIRCEASVIVARARDGSCVHLPVQQNLHRNGILAVTQVPAPDIDAATAARMTLLATELARTLEYVGVLCVEFFVLEDGRVLANEMAPRPHNSGHWSIEGAEVSQFELQLRALVGWPLGVPRARGAAVMLNLLGDLWFEPEGAATAREPDWPAVLALEGVHLHLYGKAEPRRGRKMGHLTVTAPSAAEARATALAAAERLGLAGF